MGFFDRLFGRKDVASKVQASGAGAEQAVIVSFQYGSTDLDRLFALERRLEAAIAKAGAGKYDGNEIATDGTDGRLYMYGPDADRLFAVVRPLLEAEAFMRGARVVVRYGTPSKDVRQVEVVLGV